MSKSTKHPALEYIFNQLTSNGQSGIGDNHAFTIADMIDAYQAVGVNRKRASISNTILDLTRKNKSITSRLPQTVINHGYDLRKKTGRSPGGSNYMGEFVFVGIGNSLNSWLVWPETPDKSVVVENRVPDRITGFLSNDEGALFSVIDYCDALSLAIYDEAETVIRVQNPMKWQPNEIDGLYFSDHGGEKTLFPAEAKALSTKDDINLEQMLGGFRTIKAKIPGVHIVPLAIQMTSLGMNIGILKPGIDQLELDRFIQVIINPPIPSWQPITRRRKALLAIQ
jgi:hypothetical protein